MRQCLGVQIKGYVTRAILGKPLANVLQIHLPKDGLSLSKGHSRCVLHLVGCKISDATWELLQLAEEIKSAADEGEGR
jgi:hypothetical protein